MGCLEGIAKVLKSLRMKKCKSSCCNIEIESGSPPNSPASTIKKSADTELTSVANV